MDQLATQLLSTCLQFPANLVISDVEMSSDRLTLQVALTLSHSNGQTEAQVNKLKLVKRQMYGRAKLPLLRQRLLHAV